VASRRSHLARRRKELGLSQERLAELIRSDRTTIGRIERGETTPHPHTRDRLSRALRVTPEQLTALLARDDTAQPASASEPASYGSVVLDLHTTGVNDMHRRILLRQIGFAGAMLLVPPGLDAEEHIEARLSGDPGRLGDLNSHLWQVFALSPAKQTVYPLVEKQLRVIIDRLDSSRSDAEHRAICALASELFQLAGEICFDGAHYADAAHCYTLAASAAKESRAHDHWACALTRHAYVSMFDRRYQQASTVLSAAAKVAARGDSQLTTRHWVASVRAQAYAGLRDTDGCERALDAAQQINGVHNPVTPGGWLRFDGSRLDEERGTCYLNLGRSELAAAALTSAFERTTSSRRRGSVLAELAVVGVRRRDPDEVLQHAHAARDLAERSPSPGYVGHKLRTLQTHLPRLGEDSRITVLDERITDVLQWENHEH
jgi:transcriptional regulator with XRE-family HTH domain/tetratricopeptide (TPR) repeat protein